MCTCIYMQNNNKLHKGNNITFIKVNDNIYKICIKHNSNK